MTVQEKMNIWLNESKAELINSYDRKGLRASGKWADGLETETEFKEYDYIARILGEQYTGVLESGRSPNKNTDNIKAWVGWAGSTFLKEWVEQKGLNINPFAVAWKIGREGIKVPNEFNPGGLVSDVITKERIEKLIKDIGFVLLEDLKSDVIKKFK